MEEHFKDNNKKKRIIEEYNSSSYFYDRRYRTIQEVKYEIVIQDYNINGKMVLDMGCGTGLFFQYLKESIINKRTLRYSYVAVDISWNMLLEFKSKISRIGLSNPILLLSDIENLPFRDNVFNSVFSLTSFQNLPYIKKGIKESVRVCQKNGEMRLSILKKKLKLEALLNLLKSKIKNPDIIDMENLEDYIINGKILKD